jgi:hypothetical protein
MDKITRRDFLNGSQIALALHYYPPGPECLALMLPLLRWVKINGTNLSPDLLWEPDWPNENSKPWVIGR